MRKQKFNLNKWVRNWVKRNNVEHTHSGRFVATSHKRDRMFLGENKIANT